MHVHRKSLIGLVLACLVACSYQAGYHLRAFEDGFAYSTEPLEPLPPIPTAPPAQDSGETPPESVYGTGKSNWSQVGPAPLDDETVETLNALGYLDGYEPPTSTATGVVLADLPHCFGGYRLYVSGHKPEATLISSDGALVHTWSVSFSSAFPDVPAEDTYASRFRRAYVYPNGDLLAIFDLAGLVKLDVNSAIEWVHPGASHHDFDVQPDGTIYVIDSAIETVPEQKDALIGYITHLTGDGEVLFRVSFYECLKRSQYAPLLTHIPPRPDILHTNTLEILDAQERQVLAPLLANGERQIPAQSPIAMVSWREIDTIALIDLDAREVVWALTGLWKGQHEPVVTERGTILVFDNRGPGEWSRIVEVDPVSQAVVWEYKGTPETPFSSMMGGAVHLLPNGGIFVVETTKGRAFELTRDKKIVWEYLSPHRIHLGEELVANLYDMVPVAAEDVPFVTAASAQHSS